jgi:hypothetical protein
MADSASALPPEGLRVLHSAQLTRRQLDKVLGVYEQAFPPELRVPFADLASPSPAGLMLVAVDRGEPVGFAANMLLGQSGWAFLRYYGISASRRRQGIGLSFWRLLRPALTAAGWPTQIVFEVEDPRHAAGDAAEERVRRGRIAFWRSCGVRLLDVSGYVMPELTDQASPEPMLLMAYTAGGGELSRGAVAGLVTTLYSCRYGLEAEHPMVVAAVTSISN